MADKKLSLWKRVLAYGAFSIFALVVALFLTFPYDALSEAATRAAASQGLVVHFGRMGPGFFAVRATDVELSRKPKSPDAPTESFKLDSVSVGPSLFPFGVKVATRLLGGTVVVRVSGMSTTRVVVDVEDLDLSKGNLKGFSGVDFSGQLDSHLDFSLPRAGAEPDLSAANGTWTVEAHGLSINGGTANIAIPQFGPEPAPIDLPKIGLGDVTISAKVDKGSATVEEFKAKSPDLELALTGTLKLGKRIDLSEPNLELRIKPEAEFQKRLGLLGSALSMIPADPKDPTWRMGHLTGFLSRPQFR